MNDPEEKKILNQKEDNVQVYENDDAYLFGEEASGEGSLDVEYKGSLKENQNKIINQKELLNKFNTNLSEDDNEQDHYQIEEKNENEDNNINKENIIEEQIKNNNNQNNSFKDKKFMINDIDSDIENEEGIDYEEENQGNLNFKEKKKENENEKFKDNYLLDNKKIQNNNLKINDNKENNNNINNEENNIENQNEEMDENESDSGVPLVTLNFLSICQCCKNSFNSKENIPYLFKCGHFFCKQCILEQFTDEEGIKCPNDGLIANTISELKVLNNFITDKTVTQRTSSPFSSPDVGLEKNKFNQKIINNNIIGNNEKIQNYKSCEFHKGQKLTHFIEETKELICVYCAFERFKQNQGIEIKEISDKCHDMETEMDSFIEENQYNVGIIQTSLKEIKKNKETEEKKVNEIFDRFIEIIKSKKEEFLNKIDNLFTNNAEKLSQKLELFSNKIEKSETMKEKINIFLNSQDTCQFLQLYDFYNKIMNDLQSINSLKLNLQKYKFNYEEEMSISRMISKFGEIKLTPKIFTFIGNSNSNKEDQVIINENNNYNNIEKLGGTKVKLNNNDYNNIGLNDNFNNLNYDSTFHNYNDIILDNNEENEKINRKNNSSTNFYKKSLNLNSNSNTNNNNLKIKNYKQENKININDNNYIDYSNHLTDNHNYINSNIYNNKNINTNTTFNSKKNQNKMINYDKYSIPKNLNNDILNKGRNSSLNGGIRLNTPNSLSKIYSSNCNNNNHNLIIKNNYYDNSMNKRINNNKINLTQIKNNRNTKPKNNKKNNLQFKFSHIKYDNYKNKSYSFLGK